MSRRRRRESVEDEDDDETPDSGAARGYREAQEREIAESPPEGELFEPTPKDQEALDGKLAQERNRIGGMLLGVTLLWWTVPPSVVSPWLSGLLVLAGLALIGYALWSYFIPHRLGPMIVRVAPHDEIAAGHSLTITVLLQPRQYLELDPLKIELVARRAVKGSRHPEITRVAGGVVVSKQAIEARQPVRLQTTLLVPEEAPPTSLKRGVTWRVEVSIGDPPVLIHGTPIRVLPLDQRSRERAVRLKARDAARRIDASTVSRELESEQELEEEQEDVSEDAKRLRADR